MADSRYIDTYLDLFITSELSFNAQQYIINNNIINIYNI